MSLYSIMAGLHILHWVGYMVAGSAIAKWFQNVGDIVCWGLKQSNWLPGELQHRIQVCEKNGSKMYSAGAHVSTGEAAGSGPKPQFHQS